MNSTRYLIFTVALIALLAVGSYFSRRWALAHSPWIRRHSRVLDRVLIFFVIIEATTLAYVRLFRGSYAGSASLVWLSYALLGVFATFFAFALSVDIATKIIRVLFRSRATSLESVDFKRRTFMVTSALAIGSTSVGFAQNAKGARIYEVEVPIEGLPEQLEGFKIAQLSDLHVGPTIGRDYTQHVVDMVNSLAPDLVALTGDFVDGSVLSLSDGVAPLGQLKSRHGTYFVTGNHEYYSGALEWVEEFRRLEMNVLLNEHSVLDVDGAKLVIAGVTDLRASRFLPEHESDLLKSVQGVPDEAIRILLAHQPSAYSEAAQAGFHLQLSGHTHGGQFFPWSVAVRLAHRYYKGLNRHEKMWVYVNRGTGYWGPPIRTGVPAEVTLLRLKRA